MCLALPGRVLAIADFDGDSPLRMGRVDFGGVVKQVCLEYVPEAAVGDYVIVHVGFAIARLDEAEADRTLALWTEVSRDEAAPQKSARDEP